MKIMNKGSHNNRPRCVQMLKWLSALLLRKNTGLYINIYSNSNIFQTNVKVMVQIILKVLLVISLSKVTDQGPNIDQYAGLNDTPVKYKVSIS